MRSFKGLFHFLVYFNSLQRFVNHLDHLPPSVPVHMRHHVCSAGGALGTLQGFKQLQQQTRYLCRSDQETPEADFRMHRPVRKH